MLQHIDFSHGKRAHGLGVLMKKGLVHIGALVDFNTIHRMDSVLSYLAVGQWAKSKGFYTSDRIQNKHHLYELVADHVRGNDVLYLEFGVASGSSFRFWSNLLKNEKAKLYGFDTFEGLPSEWGLHEKGHFSTGGSFPQVNDERASFVKGLFEDTLPTFQVPPHERLVINIDCDIYAGAICVLKTLDSYIRPGTCIYFDEFADHSNELRAFKEYLALSGKRFELLGATPTYRQVAFECVS
jgi:hypothetical protein